MGNATTTIAHVIVARRAGSPKVRPRLPSGAPLFHGGRFVRGDHLAGTDLNRRTVWLNRTKNGTPRGVPLNEDAIAVLDEQRGKHAHLSSANIGLKQALSDGVLDGYGDIGSLKMPSGRGALIERMQAMLQVPPAAAPVIRLPESGGEKRFHVEAQ